ncbi:G kinase-anchoring protein 1 isoform X2 [Alosa alosa]|uniref:G kinase-anchoring protein 1 isoform X2 n=1 Tax=Alosa alosa TaxID=278164 RepID=UPI0020151A58|nr:G kinase-anchoring protein 1 isoform X2 [Alosa alosa]
MAVYSSYVVSLVTDRSCRCEMASAVISVPTTASRFALLQVDSDSDSDSEPGKKDGRSGKAGAGKLVGGKTNQNSDKKKEKKKRKKGQQQNEANELRNLAFKKLPQKTGAAVPTPTLQGLASELLQPGTLSGSGDQARAPEGWQQWKQRDEQLTSELYEADLEKALILSKLDFEQHKKDPVSSEQASPKAKGSGSKKEKKKKNQQGKDKCLTVSLKDFQTEANIDQLSKRAEKEESKAVNVPAHDDKFFDKLENEVSRIVQRDKRREQFSNSAGQEVNTSSEYEQDVRTEQLKFEMEKKDEEIAQLKKTISQWEVKYKEVKARNAQLLKMLQQGEMKDKAEILLQVDELLNIKEELSSQVSILHGSLEQERSKVKELQSDQPRHQGNRKAKKGLEGD